MRMNAIFFSCLIALLACTQVATAQTVQLYPTRSTFPVDMNKLPVGYTRTILTELQSFGFAFTVPRSGILSTLLAYRDWGLPNSFIMQLWEWNPSNPSISKMLFEGGTTIAPTTTNINVWAYTVRPPKTPVRLLRGRKYIILARYASVLSSFIAYKKLITSTPLAMTTGITRLGSFDEPAGTNLLDYFTGVKPLQTTFDYLVDITFQQETACTGTFQYNPTTNSCAACLDLFYGPSCTACVTPPNAVCLEGYTGSGGFRCNTGYRVNTVDPTQCTVATCPAPTVRNTATDLCVPCVSPFVFNTTASACTACIAGRIGADCLTVFWPPTQESFYVNKNLVHPTPGMRWEPTSQGKGFGKIFRLGAKNATLTHMSMYREAAGYGGRTIVLYDYDALYKNRTASVVVPQGARLSDSWMSIPLTQPVQLLANRSYMLVLLSWQIDVGVSATPPVNQANLQLVGTEFSLNDCKNGDCFTAIPSYATVRNYMVDVTLVYQAQ
jgi:hypothetical protein